MNANKLMKALSKDDERIKRRISLMDRIYVLDFRTNELDYIFYSLMLTCYSSVSHSLAFLLCHHSNVCFSQSSISHALYPLLTTIVCSYS